jgi:cysteine synthase
LNQKFIIKPACFPELNQPLEVGLVGWIKNLIPEREMIMVEDEDAFKTARDLFLKEGLFVGISSGSAMCGALRKAKEIKKGLIVTLSGDHGFKYLSTNLFR